LATRTNTLFQTISFGVWALSDEWPSFSGNTVLNSAAILEAHIPELRRFAGGLLRGDRERADDLVQDTLERALSGWHLRRIKGDLRGWLYTILYNRFLSDCDREKRRGWSGVSREIAGGEVPTVNGGQEAALEYRDLLRAFATLPTDQRSVLLLITVEDFSYEEAARLLGVPIGTVMSRLSRGRERLRQHMNGDRTQARLGLTNDRDTRYNDRNGACPGRNLSATPPPAARESVPAIAD
jgi:RNA polymerase sigma-70 factor (ECF subfamily)